MRCSFSRVTKKEDRALVLRSKGSKALNGTDRGMVGTEA